MERVREKRKRKEGMGYNKVKQRPVCHCEMTNI